MAQDDQESWKKLRSIRKKAKRKNKKKFLDKLRPLISDWQGRLPNLPDIFPTKEIDWLLTEAAKNMKYNEAKSFIEFVARSGYKVKPKVSKSGKQSSRRTTPLHHLYRRHFWPFGNNLSDVANWLFDIYDGIDVNYTDKSGLTHFHVACKFGRTGVVKKFLELGQDPNLIWPEEKHWPLHLAIERQRREVAELLLRAGADPNSVDGYGMTPLNVISENHGDVVLARMLFELSDEKYRVQVDHLDEFDNTPLHIALNYSYTELARFLLEMGADPNLADGDDGNNGLHHLGKMGEGDDGLADMIFGNDDYKPLQIHARNHKGNTPLHLAVKRGTSNLIEALLRHGADSNATNKKGMTPLHLLCKKYDDPTMLNLFFRINDELGRQVLIDALDNNGKTPLVWALENGNIHSAEVLLRRGADPSLGTVLNRICYYSDRWVELFFEVIDGRNQVVDINARDDEGYTPLNVAAYCGHRSSMELLLRRGGDPNLVNNKGMTALHLICERSEDDDFAERFFTVNDEIGQRVLINAQDNLGHTPLHLALSRGHRNLVALLLRRGASTVGTSPLHVICKRDQDDGLAKMYFEISKELDRLVLVDAPDELGRTPLQLALTSLLPDAIDALLANGAALPGVLPTEDDFRQRFNPEKYNENYVKLRIASGILVVIECLYKHGYGMDRTDALKIMKLFADFGLYEKSTSLEKYWYDDEKFAGTSKETMVMPSLSLYDLIQLSPKEAAKQVAPADYFKFAYSIKWYKFSKEHWEACVLHLCEKLSRRFFLSWALECFMELVHYRLPALCCDMIIENLNKQDLCTICLAATGRSS